MTIALTLENFPEHNTADAASFSEYAAVAVDPPVVATNTSSTATDTSVAATDTSLAATDTSVAATNAAPDTGFTPHAAVAAPSYTTAHAAAATPSHTSPAPALQRPDASALPLPASSGGDGDMADVGMAVACGEEEGGIGGGGFGEGGGVVGGGGTPPQPHPLPYTTITSSGVVLSEEAALELADLDFGGDAVWGEDMQEDPLF